MNIQVVALLSCFVVNVIMALIVLLKAKRNTANVLFALMCLGIAFIGLGIFLTFYCNIHLIKIAFFGITLYTATFIHFALIFPEQVNKPMNWRYALLYLHIPILTPLMGYRNFQVLAVGVKRQANAWYYVGVFYGVILIITSVVLISRKLKSSHGVDRRQLKMVLTGFSVAMLGFVTTNLILPAVFHNSYLVGVGPIFLTAIPVFTAIAIYRYRFMDIALVIKKGFVLSVLIVFFSFLYVLIFSQFVSDSQELHVFKIVLISTIITLIMPYIKPLFEHVTDRIFFRKQVDYAQELALIHSDLSAFTDMGELLDFLVVALVEKCKLKSSMFVIDHQKRFSYFYRKNSVVVEHSERRDHPLVLDQFLGVRDGFFVADEDLPHEVRDFMVNADLDVCFPVLLQGRTIAVLGVGQKLSEDIFVQLELQAFIRFVSHVKVVMEKILLYQEKLDIQRQYMIAQKNAVIGEMTRKLVHEIKNPMVALSSFFQLAPEVFSHDEYNTMKRHSMEAVNRIMKLLEDLATYNKLTPVNFALASLNDLIQHELDFIRPILLQQNVNCQFNPEVHIQVNVDQTVFNSALLNIMQNAVDAMPGGGMLTVVSRRFDHHIEIAISDTGCGIPDELQPIIFDPLVTTKKKGSGLGLAIASNIITEHQGTISVMSTPGQGACFTICLPSL